MSKPVHPRTSAGVNPAITHSTVTLAQRKRALARPQDKLVTLVIGGVRSGKSRYAQQLASEFSSVTFIATARGSDAEMRRKIAAHRRERPSYWQTIETPVQIGAAIRNAGRQADAIVVDCLTTYVANEMFNGNKKHGKAVLESVDELCKMVQAVSASVIIVSNEVGSGVVPAFRSGRLYRDLLGAVNQRIAEIADRVVLMVAGLPLTIKGQEGRSC